MNVWFTIEQGDKIVRNVVLRDANENILFTEIMLASPEELFAMKELKTFNDFIFDMFYAANDKFEESNNEITVHLTDHYGILIWSIAMYLKDDGDIDYQIYDQRTDGKFVRISSEEG